MTEVSTGFGGFGGFGRSVVPAYWLAPGYPSHAFLFFSKTDQSALNGAHSSFRATTFAFPLFTQKRSMQSGEHLLLRRYALSVKSGAPRWRVEEVVNVDIQTQRRLLHER
jgi:hypothetical protein